MLTVGIAIRLGMRLAEVQQWPLEELALVAAYCQMEQEDFDKNTKPRGTASSPPATMRGGASVRTERVHKVYVVKPKKKE